MSALCNCEGQATDSQSANALPARIRRRIKANQFGVSIVPEMARRSADGCKLLTIEPAASRRIGYVRLERRYISKPIEAFAAYLREVGRAASR